MKKLSILFALFLIFALKINAQPWLQNYSIVNNSFKNEKPQNFYDIKEKFYKHWEGKRVAVDEQQNAKKGGHQQFKRWEYLMRTRTYPTGDYFDSDILAKEFEKYKNKLSRSSSSQINASNWAYIGQNSVPLGSGGGTGRVNVLRIHPTNPNILFIGASCGGFWKSIDGGLTWNTTTDLLPSISIADIAVNPNNPDSIFIATGDGYGYEVGGNFWGGVYTGGIYLSTDGGNTWNATPLSYLQQIKQIFNRIIINPANTSVILTCSRNFILRSADNGITWIKVAAGRFYDLEFKPGNSNIVYAASGSTVYKSIDGGLTFAAIGNLTATGRMSIAVTDANPNVLYVLSENGDFWKSSDEGATFNMGASPTNSTTFYGYYDNVLGVSPTDEDFVVTGGVDVLQSLDGGQSWSLFANAGGNDYVHVDQKNIEFTANGNIAYAVNDGGVFKSDDGGNTWTDLGDNIHIKQYYKMSTGISNPNILLAGAQDNGTDHFDGSTWEHVYGGDGMDNAMDPTNANVFYVSYQYGNFARTTNGGASFTTITPSGQQGAWVTPIVIDPINSQTIYIGYQDLYRSLNRGTSWTALAANVCNGSDIEFLKIAPSNTNVIYAGYVSGLYRSIDGGLTFSNITTVLTSGGGIMDVAISDVNPDHIWVTVTGYTAGKRVYKSVDGGTTYTNVTGSLPAIPVNCAIYQPNSNDMVYIGTDFGVFYRDNTMPDWMPFNTNLPNVIISEFEIVPAINKLRVATYGRGLWESDLATSSFYVNDAGVTMSAIPAQLCTSPVALQFNLTNYGSSTLTSAVITYALDNGTPQTFNWSGSVNSLSTLLVALPTISAADGVHSLAVTVSQPNGVADQNVINDQTTTSFLITTASTSAPVQEDFETGLPINFRTIDPYSLVSVTNTAGGFGSSTSSIKANCYQVNNVAGEIISSPINMTTLTNAGVLTFDVAYARFNAGLRDSLIVQISTDCGLTWINAYQKFGNALSTTTSIISTPFLPAANQWRNETVSLTNYLTATNLLIKFRFKSNYGNNIFVDNINILQGTVGINENAFQAFSIFPNPAHDKIYIRNLKADVVDINILDISGKLVSSLKNLTTVGDEDLQIDLPKLAPGYYTVNIVSEKNKYSAERLFIGQ